MFTLYKYEIKKIFSQKYFVITFVFLFLFSIAVSITPLITGSIDSVMSKSSISGRVMDDTLFNEYYNDKKNNTYYDIGEFIKTCTGTYDVVDLDVSLVYEARSNQLEKEFEYDYLNESEKEYWRDMDSKLEKPFIYQRDDAYSEIYELVYVLNFAIFILIAVAIAGVFADEKATGADQILFSCKYGKNKLFTAKVFASLTIGFIISTVMYFALMGINLFAYGSSGFDTALQVNVPLSLYSITIGQSSLIMYVQLLFASFVYVSFALLLSIATNNHPASSGVMIVIMFLSMFNIPAKYRIISQIWDLIPSGHIGSWSFQKYQLINVFGIYFNSLEYSIIIWFLVSIAFVFISGYLYKKYQVIGR